MTVAVTRITLTQQKSKTILPGTILNLIQHKFNNYKFTYIMAYCNPPISHNMLILQYEQRLETKIIQVVAVELPPPILPSVPSVLSVPDILVIPLVMTVMTITSGATVSFAPSVPAVPSVTIV